MSARPASGRSPRLGDERGAALVMVLVLLTAVLGTMALAVDVGMLFAARGETQRAADAAALAGASAFVDLPAGSAEVTARTRAMDYAARNAVQGVPIRPGEVTVQVVADSSKVRVWIRRPGITTWFGRFIGRDSMAVGARAAARAMDAPSTHCVKPFLPPDLWADVDDDRNHNRVWDEDEDWKYEPGKGDRYVPVQAKSSPPSNSNAPSVTSGSTAATGYGSTYRGSQRDWGRPIVLKVNSAKVSPLPGWFYLWAMPVPGGSGKSDANGAQFRENIGSCNDAEIRTDQSYDLLNGNRVGPTEQGVDDLIAQDPGAQWDDATGTVVGSRFSSWMQSPRMIKVPLYDPAQLADDGSQVRFQKFAWVFLEESDKKSDGVAGRYVNTVRTLQLVE